MKMKKTAILAVMLTVSALLCACAPKEKVYDPPVPPTAPEAFYDGDIEMGVSIGNMDIISTALGIDLGTGAHSTSIRFDSESHTFFIVNDNGEEWEISERVSSKKSDDGEAEYDGYYFLSAFFGEDVISAALTGSRVSTPPMKVDGIDRHNVGLSIEKSEDLLTGVVTTIATGDGEAVASMLGQRASGVTADEIRLFGEFVGYTGDGAQGLIDAVRADGKLSYTVRTGTLGEYLVICDVTLSTADKNLSFVYDGYSGNIDITYNDKAEGTSHSYTLKNTDGESVCTLSAKRTEHEGGEEYSSERNAEIYRANGEIKLTTSMQAGETFRKQVYKYEKNAKKYTYLYRAKDENDKAERSFDLCIYKEDAGLSGYAMTSGVEDQIKLVFEKRGDSYLLVRAIGDGYSLECEMIEMRAWILA